MSTTIAYGGYSGQGGLVLIEPDSSNRRLAIADDSILYPAWSPDKSRIAFVRIGSGQNDSLMVVNRDGSNALTLANQYGWLDISPDPWSPGGEYLLFEARRPDAGRELLRVSSSGGTVQSVLPGGASASFLSADSIVCVYRTSDPDSAAIAAVRTSGGDVRMLAASTEGSYYHPRVSPARTKIAYVFIPEGDFKLTNEIWVMDTDGGNKQMLAKGGVNYAGGHICDLRFSRDGSKLLFVPDWDDLTRIHVLEIASSDLQILDDAACCEWAASDWSPIDDRIAFSVHGGGIAVINGDGTGLRHIDTVGAWVSW